MASQPSNIQPQSSAVLEVAQVTQSNPMMERGTVSKDGLIPRAHSWLPSKQDNYKKLSRFQPQPLIHPHNTDSVLQILADTQQHSSNVFHSSSLPVWKFYSMAAKGLCSKRVEDVRMNRIDKIRAGRRRRPCRRPFVFKSSPLAEGQGAGRLTNFHANSNSQSSAPAVSPFTLKSARVPGTNQSVAKHSSASAHISRFLDSRDSSIQRWLGEPHLQGSISFSAISCNPNHFISSRKQAQISQLRNYKSSSTTSTPSSNTNHYQSWEISLPKCALPKMGMFTN